MDSVAVETAQVSSEGRLKIFYRIFIVVSRRRIVKRLAFRRDGKFLLTNGSHYGNLRKVFEENKISPHGVVLKRLKRTVC